ncbi:MAG: AEC family transporter [Tissierellia bacterium]|nr:AEC family transporter [Tissierellia bacterium]
MLFVAKNVLILFAMIFIAYFAGIRKIVTENGIKDFSNFLVRVTMPLTIVHTLIKPYDAKLIANGLKSFAGSFLMLCIMAGVAIFFVRKSKIPMNKQGLWMFVLTFSNNGFLGMPLMMALYGSEGLFYMTLANLAQNILIFTLGLRMINRGFRPVDNMGLKSVLLNNINIAVVIGLFLFFSQIQVPEVITGVLGYIANMNTPLSMVVVGLSLSKYNVKDMFTDRDSYILSAVRQLIYPLIAYFILKVTGYGAGTLVPAILLFTIVLPAPALASVLSEQCDTNPKFAAQCIFITTLASMLAVPLVGGLLV